MKHLQEKREHAPLHPYKNNMKHTSQQFHAGPQQPQPNTCYSKYRCFMLPQAGGQVFVLQLEGELQR